MPMKLSGWRNQERMTQVELAQLIGISVMQLYRIERGINRPSPRVMQRIVEVTDGAVTPNDFYDFPAAAAGDE